MNRIFICILGVICLTNCGCQSIRYWWHNDLKVGPNYAEPASPVQDQWLEATDESLSSESVDAEWWKSFDDPTLDRLIDIGNSQAISLRVAEARIRESRAQRRIAAANLFPQSQAVNSQFVRNQNSRNSGNAFPGFPITNDNWSTSFDASWEVDLWGRIRRSVTAADAQVEASIKDLDFARVSLIGDVAATYIQVRSFDERIKLAKENAKLQKGSYDIAKIRFDEGATSELDVQQAKANQANTEALIPQLEQGRRQTANALGLLLSMTPTEINEIIGGSGTLPKIPEKLLVGMPAELLRRRPDIRSSERFTQAAFEQIGIAEADFYPQFAISGSFGWQSAKVTNLLQSDSFAGNIVPGFRWQILNYGRLYNNVLTQEARFEQQLSAYENTVLSAQREVEDGIIEFIKSKEALEKLIEAENANKESVKLVNELYTEGAADFGRVFVLESGLVSAQDRVVQGRAAIALAMIATYKALGGGWEIDCQPIAEAPPIDELEPAPNDSSRSRRPLFRAALRNRVQPPEGVSPMLDRVATGKVESASKTRVESATSTKRSAVFVPTGIRRR